MKHPPLKPGAYLVASLLGMLVYGSAIAEEQLPTISVTAPAPIENSEPLNASSVDPQKIESLRPATSDTAALLKNIPGINLYGGGGVSSLPTVHGLADDRLRIKVDGMDLISACENHMNPPLSYIDPTRVAKVTAFAGIAPVSVGGDSIGGAIVVESPEPEFADSGEGLRKKGEIGTFYRSNGNAMGGNVGATIANEKISLSYSGSTAQAEDYRAGDDFKPAGPAAAGRESLDGDEVGSSMYKSTNQSLAFAVRGEKQMAELKLGMQDIPYQGWPNQRMDMTGNDSNQVNLRYKRDFEWGKLETRAYNEHTRHKMQFFDDKLFWYGSNDGPPQTYPDGEPCIPTGGKLGCAAGMPMDTKGDNSGLVIKGSIPLSGGDLIRVGAEGQQYRLDDWWDPSGKGMWPDTFWNINGGERDRTALFSEWEAKWNPRWQTLVGVRYEKVDMNTGNVQGYNTTTYGAEAAAFNGSDRSKTDNNFDLTALARFTLDAMHTIELGYARKTRSPNLYERYAWSTGGMAMRMVNWAGDGNGYVGDPDLTPEIAHTVSATFDWHDAANNEWGFKATPYYTFVKDYIDARRCGSTDTLIPTTMTPVCTDANLTATDSFVYLKFVNQSARIYGIDLSGHLPLARDTSFGDFTLSGVLNYVRGENKIADDNLYNMMPLNVKLALSEHTGSWTNAAEAEWVDAKDDVSAVRNEMETDAYTLFHLRSSYAWKQARLDVGIENLFDEFYSNPLGGAYLGQGKTMTGTDVPWGVTVPGMGRSFYAGVSVEF